MSETETPTTDSTDSETGFVVENGDSASAETPSQVEDTSAAEPEVESDTNDGADIPEPATDSPAEPEQAEPTTDSEDATEDGEVEGDSPQEPAVDGEPEVEDTDSEVEDGQADAVEDPAPVNEAAGTETTEAAPEADQPTDTTTPETGPEEPSVDPEPEPREGDDTGGDATPDTEESTEPEADPSTEAEVEDDADDRETESDTAEQAATPASEGLSNLGEVSSKPDHFSAWIESGTLKDFFSDIGTLVDECKLHVGNGGIAVRSVDPANVGMIEAQLAPECFDELKSDRGVLGVNIGRVTDVLGLADGRNTLVNIVYDAEQRKLNFKQNGMEYTLATINPDSIRQEPDIPDLELGNHAVVPSKEVTHGIKAADMVAENAGLIATEGEDGPEVQITAEGDTDTCEYSINGESLQQAQLTPDDESLFSLDYLKNIRKTFPSSGTIEIAFADELPMKINIGGDDDDTNKNIEIMLAPRIQSE